MKNIKFCILLFAAIAASCSTAGAVWDDSTPPEQSAKIYFSDFKPAAYNGTLFDSTDGKVGFGCNYIFTFPAGNVDFSGDIDWSRRGTNSTLIFEHHNAAFSCDLGANEEYLAYVIYKISDDKKSRIWGVNIYNQRPPKNGVPNRDNFIGFIPFDPPVISN